MADNVEILQYGVVELDDGALTQPGGAFGRKQGRLLTLGSIEHALSDGQGNMQAGTVSITLVDAPDRPIGTRLSTLSKRYFVRDSVVVKAVSFEGRKAGALPRVLSRMLLTDSTYTGPLSAAFSAVDTFFIDSGVFGPDKKFPYATIPLSLGSQPLMTASETTPPTVVPFSGGPADVYSKALPVILGEVSDEGAKDSANGSVTPRGLCPLYYTGFDTLATGANGSGEIWGRFILCQFACYQVISLYGLDLSNMLYGIGGVNGATSDGATQSVIQLPDDSDLSFVLTTGADHLVLYTFDKGVIDSEIVGVNVAAHTVTINNTVAPASATDIDWIITPAKPCRGPVNLTERNGVDVMVPKWPGYIRPTPYEDVAPDTGSEPVRCTLIWVRGPLMWAHITGQVTLAANVIGVEDKGDGSGSPITDYFTAYYWWWINCVIHNTLQPGGAGFTNLFPQTDGDIAALDGTWEDGTTYKVRGSSFSVMQKMSKDLLPGGFKISAWFGDAASGIRDVVQMWNDNGACRTGVNEFGQIFVAPFSVDPTVDTTKWPRVFHQSRVFGDVMRTNPQSEIENVVQGQCDYDPDGAKYRQPLVKIENEPAVKNSKGVRQFSKMISGRLTNNAAQFKAALQARLDYAANGPVYVTFTGDHGLVDYPLGSGIQFTSIMGPGPTTAGYIDQPMIVLSKKFDLSSHQTTYLCLDIGPDSGMNLLPPLSFVSDTLSIAGIVSDTEGTAFA